MAENDKQVADAKKKAEEAAQAAQAAEAASQKPTAKRSEELEPARKKSKPEKAAPEQPQADDNKEKEKSGNAFVDAFVEQFSSKKAKGKLSSIFDKLKSFMRKQPDSKKPNSKKADPNSENYQHAESRNEGKNDKTLDHAQERAANTGGPAQQKDVVNRYNAARAPASSQSSQQPNPSEQASKLPTLKG